MLKKLIVILLAVAMLTGMISGCAGTAEETAENEAAVEEVKEETEAPAEETSDNAGEEASDEAEAPAIEYPISDGSTTLSLWKAWDSGFSGFFDSYSDLEALPLVEEATGVNLEIVEVGETVSSEQFNLMAASESWTDLVDVSAYYNGGVTTAYEDGVIYDLTDYIPEYMPDYYALFNTLNDVTKKSLTADDGKIFNLAALSDGAQQVQGLAIRKDWLDELGLEIPETIDQFTETMRAFYNEFECSNTIYVDKTGVVSHVYGAFGSNAFGVSASMFGGSSLAYYQKDGQVYSAVTSNEYRDYLEWFIEMYNEGLIHKDFYSVSLSSAEDEAIQSGGETGAFHVRAEKFSVLTEYAEDENYELIGIAPIVMNEGDKYQFGDSLTQTGRNKVNITTVCEDLELAMKFLNYFFTDEGYITYNYGIEGVSFEYDEAGQPQYTALITEDTNANQIVTKYTFNIIIGKENASALYGAYWQSEIDAMELWTETMGDECTMPSVALTTEESEIHSGLANDIITFAQESVLKFVTGEVELNDQTWNELQEQLSAMKIEECIAIYQDALDRYMSK